MTEGLGDGVRAAGRGETLTAAPAGRAPAASAPLRRLLRHRSFLAGSVGLGLIVAVAALAPLLPHDPVTQDITRSLAPPVWAGGSFEHPLGTDALGRDLASRLTHGARSSLLIAAGAVLIGALLGLLTGLLAGFYGRWVDRVLMGVGDVQLAFPFILLAIAILGVNPNRSHLRLILVLGIPAWIVYARVVRSRVLAEREKDYVTAARALGASPRRTLLRYVLPSVWQVVPPVATLDLGFVVIVESTLSFLGFGLPPPAPSWGAILAEGRQYMVVAPWLPVLPGLAIMLTVLCINLTADGLSDVLDPRRAWPTVRQRAARLLGAPAVLRDRPRGPDRRPARASLLQVSDLAVEFPLPDGVVRPVRGVTFDLWRGQALGIVGESGSGKSVTALSLIRLLDPPGRVVGGEVLLDGRDLVKLDDRAMAALRGRRIGMVFQNPTASLNPVLTIGFQVAETVRQHRGASHAEARALARDALRSVGIGNPDQVLRQYPFQLSGGMNQRVMIALAMLTEPDLLIADEPTSALDVTTQAQILDQLREVKRRHDTGVILITHDIALVAEFADTVLVMYAGQVCELGPVEAILRDPRHPYTRALLSSVPDVEMSRATRLEAIPGEVPDPRAVPRGCPFAPRCPHAMPVCHEDNPVRTLVGPDHAVACHLWPAEKTTVQVGDGAAS
jgi:peptide/nickel transport system permease protein